MIAILIETSKKTGIQEIAGVATQRADVETYLAKIEEENINGHVEFWTSGKSEPDEVVSSLEEWGSDGTTD